MAEHNRDAISSALLSSLGTVYDCKRTWSAWSQGTMGPEDFVPFDMQDDRIEDVVDAVIAALSSPLASDVVLQRLSERIDNIVSLAKVRFPDVITLESAWDALVSERNRLEAQLAQQSAKCDGNHGGPRCADPECWNDTPPASPPMSDADILVVAEFVGLVGPRSRVGEAHAAAVRFARALHFFDQRPAVQEVANPLAQEVIGCFDAAECEGLSQVLSETSDDRLKDLVERRLMYALHAAQQATLELICTCPSGDGSLRWPCPIHPPATPEPAPHPIAARCYTMSEPHLSGYRLILGFETLEAVDAAHTWVENVRKAHQQATPDHFPDAGNMVQAAPEPERCKSCDDTGHVTDQIGEWRGVCNCPAGDAIGGEPFGQITVRRLANRPHPIFTFYPWPEPPYLDNVQECHTVYTRPAPAAQAAPMAWPAARDVGRYGDMHPLEHMRVGLDSDNDVYVSVWGEDGGAKVEFCNPGGGGGGSSRRTREALIALMVAMEADNADRPDKDWWARRNAQAKGGAA